MLSLDEIYRPLYMHKVVVSGQKKKFLANFTKKNDLLAFIHHFMLSEDEIGILQNKVLFMGQN